MTLSDTETPSDFAGGMMEITRLGPGSASVAVKKLQAPENILPQMEREETGAPEQDEETREDLTAQDILALLSEEMIAEMGVEESWIESLPEGLYSWRGRKGGARAVLSVQLLRILMQQQQTAPPALIHALRQVQTQLHQAARMPETVRAQEMQRLLITKPVLQTVVEARQFLEQRSVLPPQASFALAIQAAVRQEVADAQTARVQPVIQAAIISRESSPSTYAAMPVVFTKAPISRRAAETPAATPVFRAFEPAPVIAAAPERAAPQITERSVPSSERKAEISLRFEEPKSETTPQREAPRLDIEAKPITESRRESVDAARKEPQITPRESRIETATEEPVRKITQEIVRRASEPAQRQPEPVVREEPKAPIKESPTLRLTDAPVKIHTYQPVSLPADLKIPGDKSGMHSSACTCSSCTGQSPKKDYARSVVEVKAADLFAGMSSLGVCPKSGMPGCACGLKTTEPKQTADMKVQAADLFGLNQKQAARAA